MRAAIFKNQTLSPAPTKTKDETDSEITQAAAQQLQSRTTTMIESIELSESIVSFDHPGSIRWNDIRRTAR